MQRVSGRNDRSIDTASSNSEEDICNWMVRRRLLQDSPEQRMQTAMYHAVRPRSCSHDEDGRDWASSRADPELETAERASEVLLALPSA